MNTLKPGTKVKVDLDFTKKFNGVYTINSFIEDTCGEGCCYGYTLNEIVGSVFWPDQLIEVFNEDKEQQP